MDQAARLHCIDTNHTDKDSGEHHLQDSEVGKEQLPDNHPIFGHPAFLEEEPKDDAGEESEKDLGPMIRP
jgi:hypothetical protein